jgi:hypothetical protein
MDERYRLIFRGEILDGQHRAVVKRRLTDLLALKEEQVEKLFSGKPVVLKRGVDRPTAARYQALFRKAGGQLRVKPEPTGEAAAASDSSPSASPMASESDAAGVPQAPDFKVQATYFPPPEEPRGEIQAPDFSVAPVGSVLIDASDAPAVVVPEVDFELAEVGADMLTERKERPMVELGPLDFEVAEVGADIGPPARSIDAKAPDVSHLAIVEP